MEFWTLVKPSEADWSHHTPAGRVTQVFVSTPTDRLAFRQRANIERRTLAHGLRAWRTRSAGLTTWGGAPAPAVSRLARGRRSLLPARAAGLGTTLISRASLLSSITDLRSGSMSSNSSGLPSTGAYANSRGRSRPRSLTTRDPDRDPPTCDA